MPPDPTFDAASPAESSKRRSVPEASLGQLLKSAREAKGLSIAEIANETKIGRRMLESIERNEFRDLPGGIFNRAFIRAFARQVGIDVDEGLALYERAQRKTSGVNSLRVSHGRSLEIAIVGSGAGLALLLAAALWYLFR